MEIFETDGLESPERHRLIELEKSGNFVFHGSGTKVETLEPRQAHNYPTKNSEDRIPDGEPAVFASDCVDVAIFMSIINRANAPKGLRSGFSIHKKGEAEFRATKETLDQLNEAVGYVYVFDKSNFTQRGETNEFISVEPVQPVEVIEVTKEDLPRNIEVKDF